ncbi:MAG: glycosyltransferase family 2 protein [Bacilli bacterium]
MICFYIISLVLILIGVFLFLISILKSSDYKFKLKPRTSNEFAILIPARDESKVIEGLLKSIKKQIDNLESTYIIVESLDDPTCLISKKYNANIILKKDLTKKRKGYALDDAIKEIILKKHYDLYFIFDADNILEKDFIEKMLETYQKGYDIGVGYRNIKNGDNVISACSGLTFSIVNVINEIKNKLKKVVAISGTGYFISGDIINKLESFPFISLTEDYEISLYAQANNLSTFYNKNAIFYDEQPKKMSVSIKQRTRWIKGFFEARKIRLKNIKNNLARYLGLIPYLFIVSGLFLFIFSNLFGTIYFYIISSEQIIFTLINLISIILIIYIILFLFTWLIIIKDKKINLNTFLKIKTVLFNPIFLASYLNCFIKAITKKEIKWDRIEHIENKLKKY